jgi:hypothetical protein
MVQTRLEIPFEIIDLIIGRICNYMRIKGSNLIWIVCILSILYSLAKFPISLTIELVSSDENGATLFSCVKQK